MVERVLPYGRALSPHLDKIRTFTRKLAQEALQRIRKEGKEENNAKLGTHLIMRGLVNSGLEMTEDEMADSCLNYVLAGGSTRSSPD